MDFHNNSLAINKLMYSMCESLIKDVCNEFDADDDKVKEVLEKYLSSSFVKVKALKDKNKPKRPANAYQLFSNDNRAKIQAKYPNEQMGFISKKLGEMWKNCSEKDKKSYNEKAATAKEEYEEQMKEYNLNK